jgi:cytochrome b-561
MVLFLSLGALAIFAYKMLPGGHFFQKLVHTFFHTLAITCSIAGFAVEYWWKNKTDSYHFWTLHSWLGIAVLVMYWLQYVVGLVSFLLPGPILIAKRIRAQVVLGHRHVGLILVVLVGGTILSGIAGREWYLLVGQAHLWPVLGDVRKASYTTPNALGLFTGSLIVLCLFVFRHIKPAQDDHHYSPIRDIEYR